MNQPINQPTSFLFCELNKWMNEWAHVSLNSVSFYTMVYAKNITDLIPMVQKSFRIQLFPLIPFKVVFLPMRKEHKALLSYVISRMTDMVTKPKGMTINHLGMVQIEKKIVLRHAEHDNINTHTMQSASMWIIKNQMSGWDGIWTMALHVLIARIIPDRLSLFSYSDKGFHRLQDFPLSWYVH